MLGTFKGGSSFALGLVMRTVDDHIHVFNVPKGMEQKTPEEVRCAVGRGGGRGCAWNTKHHPI